MWTFPNQIDHSLKRMLTVHESQLTLIDKIEILKGSFYEVVQILRLLRVVS